MTDHIFVTGLLVHAHHGVMPHEEEVGQRFVIDLELTVDLARAGESDKLADTVSYSSIVDTATRAFTGKSFRLVETAAAITAEALLASFPKVSAVRDHRPQAARADRGDLQRRRGVDPAPAPWLRRCSRSAAMSATCARPSIAPSPCCARGAPCGSWPARRTIARRPGASPTSRRSSTAACASTPHSRRARCSHSPRA